MANPYAKTLSGRLMCPHCEGYKLTFIEDTGPQEKRYRCKDCGGYMRYQYRNRPQENDQNAYQGHKGLNFTKANHFLGNDNKLKRRP